MAKAKASNIFVWVLLALLIVGLMGFGATNFGGSIRAVATVGDTEVGIDRYGRELQQELRALGAQTGQTVPLSQARDLGVDQAVLSRLVGHAALENEANRLSVSVGDEVVSREILAIPAFRGIDGEFDREAYQFALENQGMSVAEFENRVRAETASGVLQSGVASSVSAPDTYVDTLLTYVLEQRDITWARMSEADLADAIAEPSEEDLRAYHEANADAFTLPETRAITFAWLTPDMLRDSVDIDQAALEARYQERFDEFNTPERRLVERLVFGTNDEAATALAAIETGETTFDQLVAERGLTLEDVDLGDVAQGDLGAAADAVFGMAEPGVTGPHDSELGPALFRMNAVLAAQETTLDEAEEDLRAELAADRARRVIDDSISDIDDLLAGGATLEDLAAETEMELGQIDWRADVSDGIAAYEAFRSAAGELTEGDFPEVLSLEDGGIFAMRLDEIRPPTLQPLSDVRPLVISGWEEAEITTALESQAQSLAGQIANGREMAGIGLPLETDRNLTRDGFVSGAPEGLVADVFDMEPGEVRVVTGPGEALIVRLDAVRAPDLADPSTVVIRQAFGQQAQQQLANDVLTAYTNALIDMAGVDVNQAAINAVHAQFP